MDLTSYINTRQLAESVIRHNTEQSEQPIYSCCHKPGLNQDYTESGLNQDFTESGLYQDFPGIERDNTRTTFYHTEPVLEKVPAPEVQKDCTHL